jgi:hypothetical protein
MHGLLSVGARWPQRRVKTALPSAAGDASDEDDEASRFCEFFRLCLSSNAAAEE